MKGLTVRIERIRRGLKQSELGEKIGLTQPVISTIESMYRVSPDIAVKIREVLRNTDKLENVEKDNRKHASDN